MRLPAVILAFVLVSAAGCGRNARPDLPPSCPANVPVVEVVERRVYVPIDKALTAQESIAEGSLALCPQVAAERRAAVERLNGRMQAIEAQQGTAVKP